MFKVLVKKNVYYMHSSFSIMYILKTCRDIEVVVTGGILQTHGLSANHDSAGLCNENLLLIYEKLVNVFVGGTRSGNGDIPTELTMHVGNAAK